MGLRCVDGSLYTGWTVDLQRRLTRHQAGTASRYTASRLPVELAWLQELPDRRAARRKETVIKSWHAARSSRCWRRESTTTGRYELPFLAQALVEVRHTACG